MNEIADFKSTDGRVVEVSGFEIIVDCGDLRPTIGHQVGVGTDRFRIIGYDGQRRVTAQSLGDHHAKVDDAMQLIAVPAMFPFPAPVNELSTLKWVESGVPVAPRHPALAELRGTLEARNVGHPGLDAVAPLPLGGAILIVSKGSTAVRRALAALGGATISVNASQDATYRIHGAAGYLEIMAWRVAAAWTAYLRDEGQDVVLAGTLPLRDDAIPNAEAVQSGGVTLAGFVDGILDSVTATKTACVTTVLHLDVSADHHLHPILESLQTGGIDAIWIFDAENKPELTRSNSKASDGAEVTRVLTWIANQKKLASRSLMGLVDPEDEDDAEAIRLAPLSAALLDAPDASN